jgi:hypothetical protein
MEVEPVKDMPQIFQLVLGVFDGNTANDAVHFIPLRKEKFRQVRAILAGYPGYQCFFHRTLTA